METARKIIDRAIEYACPYAVFVRDGKVEFMPANGRRYESLQRQPERMALLVGVYDGHADLRGLEADLVAAGATGG